MSRHVTVPELPEAGTGAGAGAFALLKNLSDESSSRTYQKYCAIGIINEPTTRTAINAVYFPVIM